MRLIVRQPGRDRLLIAAFWALVGILFIVPHSSTPNLIPGPAWFIGDLLLTLALGVMLAFTAYVFITRVNVDGETMTLYALRRRERATFPFERIVGYHMDKAGEWWLHTRPEGTTCTDPAERTRIAVREPWELHRLFVMSAAKKLGGHRRRFPGTPPTENFRGLWVFDVERFAARALPQIAGMLTGCLVAFLLSHHRNPGAYGQFLGLLFVPLVLVWERLDIDDEGMVHHSPFHRRQIRWGEATAIFREGSASKRSFVIVGPDCAIHLPAHLAIDRDLIEKVLYSLPDPILCVNFDETTFRGYRRRKKAKEKSPARSEDLLPALTA